MKNSQKGFVVPLLIAIIVVLVIGGGIYIYENKKVEVPIVVDNTTQQPDQVQQTNSQNPSVTKGTNNYSFKSIDKGKAKTGPYDDYSVEIYKNNKLVSTVDVSDDVEVHDTIDYTMIEPTLFVVSPDQKYVAFKSAVWGGSCVGIEKPIAISLNDFSIKKFDRSGIDDKYGSEQKLVSLRWISNDTVQASMIFGDKDIGGCSNGKETDTNVNFTVVTSGSAPQQKEMTITTYSGGNFSTGGVWITPDVSGKKWTIDYSAAAYYQSWVNNGQTLSRVGDINTWLTQEKQITAPNYDGPGIPGTIQISGTVDSNGVLNATKIIQHVQ